MLMKIARKINPYFPGTIPKIKPEVKIWLSYEREKCVFGQLISNITSSFPVKKETVVYFAIKVPRGLY